MNGLEDVRRTVYDALFAGVVDDPFGMRPSDPRTIVAEVAVIVAVDGAEPAQLAALDLLQAIAWIALETVGTATLATPQQFVAGGATLHAVALSADVDVDVRTLCPPVLTLN